MARRPGLPALLLVTAATFAGCAGSQDLDLGYPTDYPDDASYVYDDLASYGTWIDVPEYGTVWCPEVASSWHPYTVGYWLYTDAGWFWASEDPWGSMPYHYGRWAFDDSFGWVWVPGDIWAPSWVAWRYGSGWVGWAPLPPDVAWDAYAGIDLPPYDLDNHIDPREWCFTKTDGFGTHRMRDRVEPFDKNGRLLKETRNVTKYAAGSHPVETGMTPALLLRGKEVEPYHIVDSSKPVAKNGLRIRGRQLEVYRPIRDREKPEVRTAQREEVARASSDETRTATKEEVLVEHREPVREPVRERREPVTVSREDARGRIVVEARQRVVSSQREQVAKEREEARQREQATQQREVAQRREEAARQREEATQQRENVARQREESARKDEEARQREAKSQAREKTAAREEAEKNRKSTFESRERENTPKRGRGGPAS